MIPNRVEALRVLRLMSKSQPILMICGEPDGYGDRWTMGGQQVQPALARYLMQEGFIAETGTTGFGAKKLELTAAGRRVRDNGIQWWASLSLLEKLKVLLFG